MSYFRTAIAGAATAAMFASTFAFSAPTVALDDAPTEHTKTDGSITSVGDVSITYSLFRPAGSSAAAQVPVVIHSHGWGGARTSDMTKFTDWLDAGFAVMSFDQRGFGASGGKANVEDPDLEGQDVIALIDELAALEWIEKDVDADGNVIENDPVLGGIGASYGGGFQWVTALTEMRDAGDTRFNALAPEISWYDLPESLAPQGVVRTAWVSALFAAGIADVVEYVHPAYAYGAATGQWPDGTAPGIHNLDEEFQGHGPSGFVEDLGIQLDIPVLILQGATDNLFNLNQGYMNFTRTVTDAAREQSIFVGYNGGHALPEAAPLGRSSGGDECSPEGGFSQLSRDFFTRVFAGEDTSDLMPAQYNIATANGTCVNVDSMDDYTAIPMGVDISVTSGVANTTGAGNAVHFEIPLPEGTTTVAGVPLIEYNAYSAGVDQRMFLALSVGTNQANAQVIQHNVMPVREFTPALGDSRLKQLQGMAIELAPGEKLFLTVSPYSTMFAGHGSVRSPGAMAFEDVVIHLPIH